MNQPPIQQIAQLLQASMQAGQFPLLTVTSNSMAPLLQTGDQVQLEPVTWKQLQPGDIITVVTAQDLLTHRLWKLHPGNQLQTRGDRVLAYDPLWQADQLLGRVISRQRGPKTINLRTGNGRRLNQHLAQIAALTNRHLIPPQSPPHKAHRLSHRLLHAWARLLTIGAA